MLQKFSTQNLIQQLKQRLLLDQYDQDLKISFIESPINPLLVIGDEKSLYFLDFIDQSFLDEKLDRFQKLNRVNLRLGTNSILEQTQIELESYFKGTLKTFTVPIQLNGTGFQEKVWKELRKLPFGQTLSYSSLAFLVNSRLACRSVGQANHHNPVIIIIPCHRIIQKNGHLGGYGSGLEKKQWLLDHEKAFSTPLSLTKI